MSDQTYTLVDPVTKRVVALDVSEDLKNKSLGTNNSPCSFYRTGDLPDHSIGQVIDAKKGTAVDFVYTMAEFKALHKEAFRLSDIVVLRITEGSLECSASSQVEHTSYRNALRALYGTYAVSDSIPWPTKPTELASKL